MSDGKKFGLEAAKESDERILEALKDGPKSKNELIRKTRRSRSTIDRRTEALRSGSPPMIFLNGDGDWQLHPDYEARQKKEKDEAWRHYTLDRGGTAYPSIVQHAHNVCLGLIYLADGHGAKVNRLVPNEYLNLMGMRYPPEEQEKVEPFIANAREHLREGYCDVYHNLTILEEMQRQRFKGREELEAKATQMIMDNLTLDDIAIPDWYTPSPGSYRTPQEGEQAKEDLFKHIGELLIREAYNLYAGKGSMFTRLCSDGDGAIHLDHPLWTTFCPEGKEDKVIRFIRTGAKRLHNRIRTLDGLQEDIERDTNELERSIAEIVNQVMSNKRLKGTCPSCPVPPFNDD